MMMFRDLAINLAASLIYDFSKGIGTKSETVQTILKKLGASSSLHDFPNRYVEALVDLRFAGKDLVVLEFFREESIMEAFYDYYYGASNKSFNDHSHAVRIAHCLEALRVGDAVKAASVDVAAEVQHFWEVFRQKVKESRTVKEVEAEQELRRLRATTDNMQEMMSKFLAWMEEQGKETIEIKGQTHDIRNAAVMSVLQQFAEKVFNISSIGTAHFHIYGDRKIPHSLTAPPFLPEVFLGREDDLVAIHDQFFFGGTMLLLVNGIGGVGKTSLASQYYHTYKGEYVHVAWVLSEKNIANALLLLAVPLELQFPPQMNTEKRLEVLLLELANLNRPCLLVLDNANELPDLEANYQRLRRCSNFHLLLTTRITELANAATFPIDGLPEAEALQLFKKYYPRFKPEKEEAIFKEIRTAVDGNTLVVELLAKNLALFNRFKTNYTLAELLADLRQKGLLQLTQSQEVVTDYQSKVGVMRKEKPEAIISAMYDLGDLPEEDKALLSIFAVLPAESIPYKMLEALLPGIENLDKTLGSLVRKGWLAEQTGLVESTRGLESEPDLLEAEQAHFKCSPVIQEIVRLKNPDLRSNCQILVDALIEKLDYEEGTGRLLNVTGSEALDFVRYAESVVFNLPQPTTDISKLADRVGSFHKATGNLERALYHYQRKVQFDEALCVLKPDNLNSKRSLAISYSKHGSIYFHLGNFKQAIDLYEMSHKIFRELNETYPQFKNELAISCGRLGDLYLKSKNLEHALTFFTQYNQLKGELHESHPQDLSIKSGLAISYGKLGAVYFALSNWQQALISFEKFNSLNEEVCQADSQNMHYKDILGISFGNLGDIHSALGNLDQALIFLEKFNAIAEEVCSKSPQIASFKNSLADSYSNLGLFYKNRGDKAMAKYYFEQCYLHWEVLSETSYAEYRENFEWVKNELQELND